MFPILAFYGAKAVALVMDFKRVKDTVDSAVGDDFYPDTNKYSNFLYDTMSKLQTKEQEIISLQSQLESARGPKKRASRFLFFVLGVVCFAGFMLFKPSFAFAEKCNKKNYQDFIGQPGVHSCDLISVNLRFADLQAANFKNANLRDADLRGAKLQWANFENAGLFMADLHRAYLSNADLTRADLRFSDLSRAILRRADLREVDLRGADLKRAYLVEADLRGADLRLADLSGADLAGVDFRGAYLRGADLQGADLIGVDLRGAIVTPSQAEYLKSKGFSGFIVEYPDA